MFSFNIISTITTRDHSDNIKKGDVICQGDPADSDEVFSTKEEAVAAGEYVLTGLDGGRALNAAYASAVVEAVLIDTRQV